MAAFAVEFIGKKTETKKDWNDNTFSRFKFMRFYIFSLTVLCLFAFTANTVFAQQKHQKLTIILLRHAEKDKEQESKTLDPDLSTEGAARAQRLINILNKYKPDAVFSTQFKRTYQTIRPFALTKRMMVQFYNVKNLDEIAAIARAGNFKRIVIVGHNSTTPLLANLLIGENKYKFLGENEYDKMWIIKIKKREHKPDIIKEKVISY